MDCTASFIRVRVVGDDNISAYLIGLNWPGPFAVRAMSRSRDHFQGQEAFSPISTSYPPDFGSLSSRALVATSIFFPGHFSGSHFFSLREGEYKATKRGLFGKRLDPKDAFGLNVCNNPSRTALPAGDKANPPTLPAHPPPKRKRRRTPAFLESTLPTPSINCASGD